MDSDRFLDVIRKDWCEGVEEDDLNELCTDGIKVYQIISTLDISKPKYKFKEVVEEDEEEVNEDTHVSKFIKKTDRMLKLVLYDGRNYHMAYEYEQIAAFDIFHVSEDMPRRCCSKIAVYNSPKIYRDAMWLNQYNVKLLFEGFICVHGEHTNGTQTTDIPNEFGSINDNKDTCSDIQTTVHVGDDNILDISKDEVNRILLDTQASINRNNYEVIVVDDDDDDLNIEINDDNLEYTIDFNKYFPKQSNYNKNSYILYLYNNKIKSTNEEYVKYSKDYIFNIFNDNIDITLYNLISNVNKNYEICIDYNKIIDNICNEYKYGYLNHTIPLYIHEDINDNKILQINNILYNLIDICFDTREYFKSKYWFGIFDDCITTNCFCIFSLNLLVPFLDKQYCKDDLSISNQLNSLEGFFSFETIEINDTIINIIREYNDTLDPDIHQIRIKNINEQYNLIESIINF